MLFFLLAYALSWAAWTPLVLAPRERAVPGAAWYYLHFLGTMGPMVAAFAVSFSQGSDAWRAYVGRISPRRVAPGWLAVGWLAPFALFGVAWAALRVAGVEGPGWSGLRQVEKLPGFSVLAAWGFLLLTNGPGEELGWRGFALPRLQELHSPLVATAILGVLWAGWHLPIFLYDPTFAAMSPAMVAGWLLSLLAGAIVLTWLFNASGGSALATTLFHAALNAIFMSDAGRGTAGSVVGALVMATAVLLVLRTGARLGRRRRAADR